MTSSLEDVSVISLVQCEGTDDPALTVSVAESGPLSIIGRFVSLVSGEDVNSPRKVEAPVPAKFSCELVIEKPLLMMQNRSD
jgi:hypothetical protein